jgi:hypothetical protein
MNKAILAVMTAITFSGCMAFTPSPFQRGSVVLAGDAEGVESLMDGLNGLVANGATDDPMGNSAHWTHRRYQEEQRTRRGCSNCGIYNKLTSQEAK